MSRPKRRWRVLLLLVLGLAVVGMGVLAWRADTHRLRLRLVDEAKAIAGARYPRPVQGTPALPGRFGDRADAAWVVLAEQQARSTDVQFCRGLSDDGEEPTGVPPEGCLRALEQGGPALAALLGATHAESAGPPSGLGVLDLPSPLEHPRTWVTAAYAAKLGVLRLRRELSMGDTEAALATCVDLLALARDVSWGTALAGRLAAFTVSEVAFGPCVAAVDAAPPAAKRRMAEALGRVAEGTPPFSHTLADWSVAVRAQRYAPYLGAALGELPPRVQDWARTESRGRRPGLEETVALGDGWHRLDARLEEVVAASRLPSGEALQRLSELTGLEAPRVSGPGRLALPDVGREAMSDVRVRAQLLLLRRAAVVDALRAETGRWPEVEALPPELRATPERPLRIEEKSGKVLLIDPSAPRGGVEVTLHADR